MLLAEQRLWRCAYARWYCTRVAQQEVEMIVKIYTLPCFKGFELMNALDEKTISYEVCEPTMSWSATHKIKELPVIEVDGKVLDYRKAMKWIKKQRG